MSLTPFLHFGIFLRVPLQGGCMFTHARQYTSFCSDMWRQHQKAPHPAIEHLQRLNDKLIKAASIDERDPEFGKVYASIQEDSTHVVRAMKNGGGGKIPRIPEAIHLFRTALRQSDIAVSIVKEIGRHPFIFTADQPS